MWIELEGLANLRDVGGMPTRDGGRISTGRLLRSDNLQALTPGDIDRLLEIGLTDVVDLRSEYEVESEGPGPLAAHPGVRIHQHSLFREWREGVGEDKPDELVEDRPEELPDEALPWVDVTPSVQVDHPVASFYLSYLVDRPDSIIASLRHIGGARGATLVHCAAGKDRTGWAIATLLTAAGVERDAVLADYLQSNTAIESLRTWMLDRYGDEALRTDDQILGVDESYLQAAWDAADAAFGSFEGYLDAIGIDDGVVRRLRVRLLG
jgi:protein-tyrosine phosphatase